jgi:hypothetical protein
LLLAAVARGSIVAPNGVPQILGTCGLEIYAMGSSWWSRNSCWNQVRGILEFDLRGVRARAPFRHATLLLADSGSTSSGAPQTTNLLGYVGDGVRSVADWGAPTVLVQTFTRPNSAGTTPHDVTDWLNDRIAAGDAFLGLRLEGATADTFDAFGFTGQLRLD